MKPLVYFGRKLTDLKFKVLGLNIIQYIPTEKFNGIINHCVSDGLRKIYEYDGFDAWVDYGKVVLRKRNQKLNFVWDNWSEGEISGPKVIVRELANKHGLEAQDKIKWWHI